MILSVQSFKAFRPLAFGSEQSQPESVSSLDLPIQMAPETLTKPSKTVKQAPRKVYAVDIEAIGKERLHTLQTQHLEAYTKLTQLASLETSDEASTTLTKRERYLKEIAAWESQYPSAALVYQDIVTAFEPIMRSAVKKRAGWAIKLGHDPDTYRTHGYNCAYETVRRALCSYREADGQLVTYIASCINKELSKEIRSRHNRPTPGMSLDKVSDPQDDRSGTPNDWLADTQVDRPEESVEAAESLGQLRMILGLAKPLGLLEPLEMVVLRKRYNLMPLGTEDHDPDEAHYRQIGSTMGGKSHEWARQLELRALDKMKRYLEKPHDLYDRIYTEFTPSQAMALTVYLESLKHQSSQVGWHTLDVPAFIPQLLTRLKKQIETLPSIVLPDGGRTHQLLVQGVASTTYNPLNYTKNPFSQAYYRHLVLSAHRMGLPLHKVADDLGVALIDLVPFESLLPKLKASKLLTPTEQLSWLDSYSTPIEIQVKQHPDLSTPWFKHRVLIALRNKYTKTPQPPPQTDISAAIKKATTTPFLPALSWLYPLLSENGRSLVRSLNQNPAYLTTLRSDERDRQQKQYKRLIRHHDGLMDLTANHQPFTDSKSYYLHAFLKLHPLKKRGGPIGLTTGTDALGASTTHKLFLLYLLQEPQVVDPLIQPLGLTTQKAVKKMMAQLKAIQTKYPNDWCEHWEMADHSTMEAMRKAENELYDRHQTNTEPNSDSQSSPDSSLTQQPPASKRPEKTWPFRYTPVYARDRIGQDPFLPHLVIFLNPERRLGMTQLAEAEQLREKLVASEYEKYQSLLRRIVNELQGFKDVITQHYAEPMQQAAIAQLPTTEFIKKVMPVLVQHSGKAVYSIVPDLILPEKFTPNHPWQLLTAWSDYPKLTGLQKRILYYRLVDDLKPKAITEALNQSLGLTDTLTEKGVRTVLEKLYPRIPTPLINFVRLESST